MKKKVFLHIGLHKTGTKTIQKFLANNSKFLEECNFLYPVSGKGHYYGHHNLAFKITGGRILPWDNVQDRTKFYPELGGIDHLISEIILSKYNNCIISSEVFENANSNEIEYLSERFSEFNTQVILFIREQSSYLLSAWIQLYKTGVTRYEFKYWLDKLLMENDSYLQHFGDYYSLIKNWESNFSKDQITILRYPESSSPNTIIIKFLKACGIKKIEIPNIVGYENISPGKQEFQLFMESVSDFNYDANTITTIFSNYHNIVQQLRIPDTKYLIDKSISEKIFERFEESNNKVSLEYFDGKPLFELEPPIQPNIKVEGEWSAKNITKIFSNLLNSYIQENKNLNSKLQSSDQNWDNKYNNFVSQLTTFIEKNQKQEIEINQAKESLQLTKKQHQTLEGDFIALQDQHQKQVTSLENQLAILQDQHQKQVTSLENQLATLQDQHQKQVTSLEDQLATLQDQHQKQVTSLEDQLATLQDQHQKQVTSLSNHLYKKLVLTEYSYRFQIIQNTKIRNAFGPIYNLYTWVRGYNLISDLNTSAIKIKDDTLMFGHIKKYHKLQINWRWNKEEKLSYRIILPPRNIIGIQFIFTLESTEGTVKLNAYPLSNSSIVYSSEINISEIEYKEAPISFKFNNTIELNQPTYFHIDLIQKNITGIIGVFELLAPINWGTFGKKPFIGFQFVDN